jgi:hypothetical protein
MQIKINAHLMFLPFFLCRYLDPAAQAFVLTFLNDQVPRPAFLAWVGTTNPDLAAELELITDSQWGLVKAYMASIVPTWGTVVMSGWLAQGGGGLVVTKTLQEWMFGGRSIWGLVDFVSPCIEQ